MNTTLVTPKRMSKVRYTYEPMFNEHVVPQAMAAGPTNFLVTKIVVTLEDDPSEPEYPLFIDIDVFGHRMTKSGNLDKRTGTERIFIARSENLWVQDYINDAATREGWTAEQLKAAQP